MPVGVYKHKPNQGYQKGHTLAGGGFSGKKHTEEARRKIAIGHTGSRGYKHSEETKKKMGESNSRAQSGKPKPWKRGILNQNWKGGITPTKIAIHKSLAYKLWRTAIFVRDNWTCIWCGSKKNIEADHIISFSSILDKLKFEQGIDNLYEKAMHYPLLWDTGNGRTLCHDCHKTTDTYGFHK